MVALIEIVAKNGGATREEVRKDTQRRAQAARLRHAETPSDNARMTQTPVGPTFRSGAPKSGKDVIRGRVRTADEINQQHLLAR